MKKAEKSSFAGTKVDSSTNVEVKQVSQPIAKPNVSSSTVKLTEDVLRKLGFRGEGKDITNKPAYRLEVPKGGKYDRYYHYQIQIVLGDYPESNGNSGILSLYDPEIKNAHCLTWEKDNGKKESKKIDYIMWNEDGQRGGIKYVTFKERVIPIAWHVTTLERLNEIYVALTGNEPLQIKVK